MSEILTERSGSISADPVESSGKEERDDVQHVRHSRGASQCGGEGRADSRRALARRGRLVLCGQRCGGFPEEPARVRGRVRKRA